MGSSRQLSREGIEADLTRAAHGWNRLHTGSNPKIQSEVVQAENARGVYRLLGVGKNGSNVIAKRSKPHDAQLERMIYEQTLPTLPNRQLSFYGYIEAGKHAWIYIEEAPGREYDPSRHNDREIAGEWLAVLHTHTDDDRRRLPICGPGRYAHDLSRCRALLRESISDQELTQDSKDTIASLLGNLATIARHWEGLMACCERVPQTLTHGDFKEDNIRVDTTSANSTILAFDWHVAAWGAPALDQAKFLGYSVSPDIDAYCLTARDRWPWINAEQIHHLGYIGETFRCVASIRWEAERMRYGWLPNALANLVIYDDWLQDTVRGRPWRRDVSHGARRIVHRSWV